MKNKKLILSATLLLGVWLASLQAQTMNVRQTNNIQIGYALNGLKKLTFASGNIIVSKTTGSPDSYPLSGIRYLNFQNITTSIAVDEKQDEVLKLFPNPVSDMLNIQLPENAMKGCVIDILSVEGRLLYSEKINKQEDAFQVNVSMLPQGLYFCRISNPITSQTTRFIKQ
ncbi:MAG: T9SS type A sorting domain-containing protein [Bacteroidota bacterium]